MVPADAPVVIRRQPPLRGEAKLEAALGRFGLVVAGRTCLDVGAAAGGFTRVLLRRGAARVFAVDAGFGQLRGELRTNPRVVNLERTNLADLPLGMPPRLRIGVVTVDMSYLSIADAVPQLEPLKLASDADLVALVKPMFELHPGALPPAADGPELGLARAEEGVERAERWRVVSTLPSPIAGSRGSREWLLHASRI